LWSITGKVKDYAGHNPLASVIMILIILTGIVAAVTGYIYYTSLVKLAGELKELRIGSLHHIFSTLFLILVILHLAGVIADVVLRKDAGNFRSMFTGYKPLKAEEGELNLSQKIFALVWMLLPFFFFYLAFLLPV
jgi:cytochrome b